MTAAPTAASAAEPWTRLERALAAVLVLALAARFLRLDGDPPYLIYENTDTYVADEPWYLKCSVLLVRFGTWRAGVDLAPFTHNPLQTLLYAGLFGVVGPGLVAAHVVAVLASVIGVACVYGIARPAGRTAALTAALVVAVSIQNFGQSRLASPENLGLTFSLAALMVCDPGRASPARCAASMAAGLGAFASKVSFVFTPGLAGAFWAWQALRTYRSGDRRAALRLAAPVAGAALLIAAFPVFMHWYAPEEFAAQNRFNIGERARDVSAASVLANEISMIRHVALDRWRMVVGVAAAIGCVAGLVLPLVRRVRPAAGIPALLLVLWGATGAVLHGWTQIQPPRYYAYLVVPLAVAGVAWAPLVAPRLRTAALLLFLAAHAAVQFPGFTEWFGRRPFASRHAMTRDAARLLDAEAEDPVVVGLHATAISLESRRCRPVDWQFADPGEITARLLLWRPNFVVGTERENARIASLTEGRASVGEELGRWTVFGRYPRGFPVVLARLVWR